jgi:hypothetical protein
MKGMYRWSEGPVAGFHSNTTLTVPGAISFNSSTHFAALCGIVNRETGDVAAGTCEACD